EAGTFQTYPAVMITEDFAASGTSSFLTGVAYNDSVQADHFYEPGEGLGGVSVSAANVAGGPSFATTTWSSGGYSLAVPAGTYRVSASGGGLSGTVTYGTVTIGAENVKRDFRPDMISTPNVTTDVAPTASIGRIGRLVVGGGKYYTFAVTYTDDNAVSAATLNTGDVWVAGPNRSAGL